MPRPGGESGKLGDRYEAVWTVDSLIDVLVGDALSITVEPFDRLESLGIEFKLEFAEVLEFHSAKRQTTGQLWSIADLMFVGANGRSVLGDLLSKLEIFPCSRVVFVSGTTARDLEELCRAADESRDAAAFQERLDSVSRELRKKFDERLLRPQFSGNLPQAWQTLRRIRVVGWDEREMIRRIDQRIREKLYRPDGASLDATAVRCLLAEMVFGWFGQSVRRKDIIDYLAGHGVAERDWARDRGPRELVDGRNEAYIRHVESELIAGERIARAEAEEAAVELVRGKKKRGVFIGAAGFGKSCAVAQTLIHLRREEIPHLALRLDMQTEVLSSRRLGAELGLPESPVIVLAGIANGGRCVLVLDQLDAISFVSGRNQGLWDLFDELMLEAERYPQMRVLLACRAFDADHDTRLRRLIADSNNSIRIDLGKLPIETVNEFVRNNAGIDPANLKPEHLDLLRSPLHLSLYLQSDPGAQPHFSSIQELLGRYWTHKRRLVNQQLGRECQWHEIIQRLVDRLSCEQTLSVPKTLLDPFDETMIAAMASQNVIVLDGNSVRFFHELFFDYCCARLFAEQGITLIQFLTDEGREQHLFRRAQVRQILEFERARDFSAYLRDMRDLLTASSIRYHLKKLALDWLGVIESPREEEWMLLESLDPSTPIGFSATRVPWGHPAWVTLLDNIGVWERWIESSDAEVVQVAVRMLSLPDVMKVCSARIARLFRPYLEAQKVWREEYCELFFFGEVYHSREMFELFLDANRRRLLVIKNRLGWSRYESLPLLKPDYAVELLAVFLDLKAGSTADCEEEDEEGENVAEFIGNTARYVPEAFAREVMPRYINELSERSTDVWDSDRRFLRRMSFQSCNSASALEQGLESALGVLAREQPQVLDTLTASVEELPHESLSALLLSSWSEGGAHYSDKIVKYLLLEPERLGLGYSSWGTGNGIAAIARASVCNASLHCSQSNYSDLEAAILAFSPKCEKENPKWLGYRRMLLLDCLPIARISHEARLHLEELKRKFPWEKFEMPRHGEGASFVRSPIPEDAVKHMTNKQWIYAMRRYAKDRDPGASFMKGGKHQFSSELSIQAQIYKSRFAQLALQMDEGIAPEYFNAILTGITTTTENSNDASTLPTTAMKSLDARLIFQVIERVRAIGLHECALDICRAIRRVAGEKPPNGIVSILCHYAMNEPDPEKEEWREINGESRLWGGDPHFHGINSVRGAAAEALGSLLFADQSYFSEIEPAVLSVVRDRSVAVRSCALVCLLAMLNFDRGRAVELFIEICEGADALLNTHYAEQFIYHATYDQYTALKPVLLRMLQSGDVKSRAIASRQIALAAFHDSNAASNLQQVLDGDAVCRKAVAVVYAKYLGHAESRAVCSELLAKFFEDLDSGVRAAAADCFRKLHPEMLTSETNLMLQFIESQACIDNSHALILPLEQCAAALPEVICRIPERLIAEHREGGRSEHIEVRRWTYHLPALIARIYEQTSDALIKSRCLNIIDDMLELGFNEIEKELAQVER